MRSSDMGSMREQKSINRRDIDAHLYGVVALRCCRFLDWRGCVARRSESHVGLASASDRAPLARRRSCKKMHTLPGSIALRISAACGISDLVAPALHL